MERIVDRSSWSKPQKIIRDVGYFPLFIIGLAPRYRNEWSGYFEGYPEDPMWGGWTTYCAMLMCLGAFLLGANFGPEVIGYFRKVSLTEKTVLIALTPLTVSIYALIGYIVANILSLPFQILNAAIKDDRD